MNKIMATDLFDALLPVLEEGIDAAFTVRGMSMWPLLCDRRDTVILSTARGRKIRRGDIVLVEIPSVNKYLLHRVTRVHPDGSIETTGDANCFRDGRFPGEYVKAVSYRVIRKGKEINCQAYRWQFLVFLWMALFPVRKILLHGLVRVSRIRGRVRHILPGSRGKH